jgi:membrane protease YdiL (CAAX protease family)
MDPTSRTKIAAAGGLGLYALAWCTSAAVLFATHSDDAVAAPIILVVTGIGFPLIAWALTRKDTPPPIPVPRPALELGVVLAFLAVYAVGFTGYGLNAFHAAFAPGRTEAVLLVAFKLVVHVGLPVLILAAIGARPGALFTANTGLRGFWPLLLVLGAIALAFTGLVSPSLRHIEALKLSPLVLAATVLASFAWLAVEAGLCEEFLFRAVLQTRLAAVMGSEAGAAALAALIFALAHVPGLYMRSGVDVAGHSANLLAVIAYAVAVLSPIGMGLGFVWARTRSLLLVVLLHACVDLLPGVSDFAHIWGIGSR